MRSILVIDCGSSSTRGILFSAKGEILHMERRKYFMDIDGDSATQDASLYRESLISICAAMGEVIRRESLDLSAMSITSQRSSVLPVNEKGEPLGKIMTWYDKRAQSICDQKNRDHGNRIIACSGSITTPVLSAPKMLWLKRNEPGIYQNACKLISIHDYLLFLCTGEFVTDASIASRSSLMDIRSLRWSEELLDIFELDEEKLCRLLPPASIAGSLTEEFAKLTGLPEGTPVISAGGDQQCSVLGQGLSRPGQIGITCGTGAYVAAVCAKPVIPDDHGINLLAAVSPGLWVAESSIPASGSVFDWFNKNFYDPDSQAFPQEEINREIASSPAGANGLLMDPDLNHGGNFTGITFSHTRADFARAVAEGLAASLTKCFHRICRLAGSIDNVRTTGGMTKSAAFNQIIADMIDMPLINCKMKETTAAGAFLAAEAALGSYSSFYEAYQTLYGTSDGTVYQPIPENAALYQKRF